MVIDDGGAMGGEGVGLLVWVWVCCHGCGFGFAVGLGQGLLSWVVGIVGCVFFFFFLFGGVDGQRGWC